MKLLHVAFGFDDKAVEVSKLKEVFDAANSWARYAPNCWLIQTNESPKTWADRFRKICSDSDGIYIVEIKKDTQAGYLEQEIWDWLRK